MRNGKRKLGSGGECAALMVANGARWQKRGRAGDEPRSASKGEADDGGVVSDEGGRIAVMPALSGRARTRPSTRTNALVERVRGEVRAAGPDDGARLRIDLDPGKAIRGAGVFEDRPAHAVEHVDLSAQAVGEGQPEDAVADDLCGGDIRG